MPIHQSTDPDPVCSLVGLCSIMLHPKNANNAQKGIGDGRTCGGTPCRVSAAFSTLKHQAPNSARSATLAARSSCILRPKGCSNPSGSRRSISERRRVEYTLSQQLKTKETLGKLLVGGGISSRHWQLAPGDGDTSFRLVGLQRSRVHGSLHR